MISSIVWTRRFRPAPCWLVVTAVGRNCYSPVRLMCMLGRVCPSAWHYLAVGGHYSQTWENSAQERVAMLHALYSIFSSPKWGPLLAKVHRLWCELDTLLIAKCQTWHIEACPDGWCFATTILKTIYGLKKIYISVIAFPSAVIIGSIFSKIHTKDTSDMVCL